MAYIIQPSPTDKIVRFISKLRQGAREQFRDMDAATVIVIIAVLLALGGWWCWILRRRRDSRPEA